MKSYFSLPNNTKYLVPSKTLINPSNSSNLICKGLAAIKLNYFCMTFHLLKYYQDQNLQF